MKLLLVVLCFLLFSCSSKQNREYVISITTERSDKNQQFATNEAPLTEEQHQNFTGLKYYPINFDFKLIGELIPNPRPQTVVLEQGDTMTQMIKYGQVQFSIDEQPMKLTVFKPVPDPLLESEDYMFVPFFDATSGSETYEGGRYVYPEIDESGNLVLDFNQASNPYCAYNHKYNCVVPPAENTIAIEIKAGEKVFF